MSPTLSDQSGGPGPTSSSGGLDPELKIWNCLNCRKRKIRCDRRDPCAHCTKSDLPCSFPVTGRAPTRRGPGAGRHEDAGWKARQHELLDKLSHLEDVVKGLQSHNTDSAVASDDDDDDDDDETRGENEAPVDAGGLGMLLSAKTGSVYIDNGLWAAVCEEAKKVHGEGQGSASTSSGSEHWVSPPAADSNSQRPFSVGDHSYEWLPLPSQMPYIWQLYLVNIDPGIKVLHVPTVSKAIEEHGGSITSMDPVGRTLMCAIVLAAIESLSDTEVMDNFGQAKSWLIPSLRDTFEKALNQAGFAAMTDLRLMQAIIIYLDCLGQQHRERTVWSMTGLLTRTAVSSGLHRDGSHFPDLTPFEAEMRRRVWWYVCLLDLRMAAGDAQAIDMAISEHSFDTREPANVNDDDLWADMEKPPVARECFTDMSFALLRCHFWRPLRRIYKYISISAESSSSSSYGRFKKKKKKTTFVQELAMLHQSMEEIEQKVLRHLDIEQPLHRLIRMLSRVNFARAELLLNYRSHFSHGAAFKGKNNNMATVPAAHELRYGPPCVAALSTIEWSQEMHEAEEMRRWQWLWCGCVPWDALGILLVGLLSASAGGEWASICERAWQAVTTAVSMMPDPLKSEPIRQPMWVVMDAVEKRREAAMGYTGLKGPALLDNLETPIERLDELDEFLQIFEAPFSSEQDPWMGL